MEMEKFICVFSRKDRDKLLDRGYTLIHENDAGGVYVFLNTEHIDFSENEVRFIRTNTLTF